MRRLLRLVAVVLLIPCVASGQAIPGNPFGGTSGGGVSLAGTNDWTGTNQFTSTFKVYATSTHTGNNFVSIVHSTNGTIAAGAGSLILNGTGANAAVTLASTGAVTIDATQSQLFMVRTGSGTPIERIWMGNTPKALTETVATAFVRIGVPSGSHTGVTVDYTLVADDATDFQSRAGSLIVAAVNKGGTVTCAITRPDGGTTVNETTDAGVTSAGTLAHTFTCAASGNNVDILDNATSSLTQTTLSLNYQVFKNGGLGGITAQ